MSAILERVTFTVPGVPVPWARARKCGKRHFTAPEMAAHMERVAYAFQAAAARSWPLDGMYSLYLLFVLPDYKTRDWDNLAKLIGDALNTLAWRDDNQITRAEVDKLVDAARPSCTKVTIDCVGRWPVRRRSKQP
jgi:Holliday junction resolvase RusA-like endonuclease